MDVNGCYFPSRRAALHALKDDGYTDAYSERVRERWGIDDVLLDAHGEDIMDADRFTVVYVFDDRAEVWLCANNYDEVGVRPQYVAYK